MLACRRAAGSRRTGSGRSRPSCSAPGARTTRARRRVSPRADDRDRSDSRVRVRATGVVKARSQGPSSDRAGGWIDLRGMRKILISLLVSLSLVVVPAVSQAATQERQARRQRAAGARPPQRDPPAARPEHDFTASTSLRNAARFHSTDMLQNGYFEHDSQNEAWDARVSRYLKAPLDRREHRLGQRLVRHARGHRQPVDALRRRTARSSSPPACTASASASPPARSTAPPAPSWPPPTSLPERPSRPEHRASRLGHSQRPGRQSFWRRRPLRRARKNVK